MKERTVPPQTLAGTTVERGSGHAQEKGTEEIREQVDWILERGGVMYTEMGGSTSLDNTCE